MAKSPAQEEEKGAKKMDCFCEREKKQARSKPPGTRKYGPEKGSD